VGGALVGVPGIAGSVVTETVGVGACAPAARAITPWLTPELVQPAITSVIAAIDTNARIGFIINTPRSLTRT